MIKKFFTIFILLNVITLSYVFAYEYEVDNKFLHQEYWLLHTKNINKVILSQDDINNFNNENLKKIPQLTDLKVFFEKVTKKNVIDLISNYKVTTEPRYLYTSLINEDYKKNLINNTDIDNVSEKNFSYGFVVKKTNLRSFPSNNSLYETPNDIEFDTIQETAVYSGTPIIILHKSKDNNFLFVKTKNYAGWVSSTDVVYCEKKDWEDYVYSKDFIVVTANKLLLPFNPYGSNKYPNIFYMGQKIPIITNKPNFVDNQSTVGNYVAKIPVKNPQGKLEFKLILIPFNNDVSLGFLPYTKENIIKQAFKMQGERYDWGGHFYGRDCSSFIQDIFNTFGIDIPRNTGEIAQLSAKITNLENTSDTEKKLILNNMELGTLLIMKGHIFMYLGFQDGNYYVISDIASVGGDKEVINNKGEKGLERIAVNQVSINTINTFKPVGFSFLNLIFKAIYIG